MSRRHCEVERVGDLWKFTDLGSANGTFVDGQRIDQAWSLELTDAGVSSAYGTLAPIVSLGEYAVVSEQEGFERLSDPRFGAQMTIMPLAMRELTGRRFETWSV